MHQTVSIETNTVEIEEKGIKLKLTVVDTPGFGDAIDNSVWFVYVFLYLYIFPFLRNGLP